MGVPGVRKGWVVAKGGPTGIGMVTAGGHDGIHPGVGALDESDVRAAHAAGLAVHAWTCDDPERISTLIAWGVDGICTNVPDQAIAIRRSIAAERGSAGSHR